MKYNNTHRQLQLYINAYWDDYFERDMKSHMPHLLMALCRIYRQKEGESGASFIFSASLAEIARVCECDWRSVKSSLEVLQEYKYINFKQEGKKVYIKLCVSVDNVEITKKERNERKQKKKAISPATPIVKEEKEKKEKKEKGVGKSDFEKIAARADERSAFFEEEINKAKTWLYEEVKQFVTEYGRDMCNDFYAYWTEPTKDKTRLRYQLQKTWSTAHRLSKWRKYEPGIMGKASSSTKRSASESAEAKEKRDKNKVIEEQIRERERRQRDQMFEQKTSWEEVKKILGKNVLI